MGTTNRFLSGFITLRVPMSLLKELQARCEEEGKTTSTVIREAIVDRLNTANVCSSKKCR